MKKLEWLHAKNPIALALMCSCAAFSVHSEELTNPPDRFDRNILEQVKTLYGLGDAAAIQRLAAEQEASDQYMRIKSLSLEGFAGAWFDAGTQRLHVALSSSDSEEIVARLGAVPVALSEWHDRHYRRSHFARLSNPQP